MMLMLRLRSGEGIHSESHEGPVPDILIYGNRYWVREDISEKQALYLDASVLTIYPPRSSIMFTKVQE